MPCSCVSDTVKYIKIIRASAKPTVEDNLYQICQKKCHLDTTTRLLSESNILAINLGFNNSTVTSIVLHSDFQHMKVFFCNVSVNDYTTKKEAYQFKLINEFGEYRIKKTTVRMGIILTGGQHVYFLKIKGLQAASVHTPVQTNYEAYSSEELHGYSVKNYFIH